MARIDVQLLAIERILNEHGQEKTYYPGDWVRVTKGHARQLLAAGKAHVPERSHRAELLTSNSGVVIWGGAPGNEAVLDDLRFVHSDEPRLEYHQTMLWRPDLALKMHMVPVGFSLLKRWQIAVPLCDYDTLAMHVGNGQDHEAVLKLVSDLRMPVYDIRLMFVRRCPDTERLFELWRQEPGERRLAFMRALFQVKPLVLALPTTWTAK